MRPPKDAGTRDKLLFYLKTKGPQTASGLAKRLDITPVGARQHLAGLGDEGLVEFEDQAGKVGRPRRIWSVSSGAAEHFPDSHSELALGMLKAAQDAFGPGGLAKLIKARGAKQVEDYRKRMPGPSAPLKERVAALTAIRREEGYLAEYTKSGSSGFRLIENHCPICVAASSCVGLCDIELELFQQVLGGKITIERTEHIVGGDRRCVYELQSK
ncbi:MAG: putative ArsR family transcriptional regulator [Planctomycetota bacterium]|jgi:predicted ArsR family transcriptional regulator